MNNIPKNETESITILPTTNPKKGRKRASCYVTEYPQTDFTVGDIVAQSNDNKYQTIYARIKSDISSGLLKHVGSRSDSKGAHKNIYRLA